MYNITVYLKMQFINDKAGVIYTLVTTVLARVKSERSGVFFPPVSLPHPTPSLSSYRDIQFGVSEGGTEINTTTSAVN
jgi:hypothetical protein